MGFVQGLGHFSTFAIGIILAALSSAIIYKKVEVDSYSIWVFSIIILATSLIVAVLSFIFMIMECCFPSPRGEISVIVRIDATDNMPAWIFFGNFLLKAVLFILCIIMSVFIIAQGSFKSSTVVFAEVILALSVFSLLTTVGHCFYLYALYIRDNEAQPDLNMAGTPAQRNEELPKQLQQPTDWWSESKAADEDM